MTSSSMRVASRPLFVEGDGATAAQPRRSFRHSPVLRFAGAAVVTAVALGTTACEPPKHSVSSSSSSSSKSEDSYPYSEAQSVAGDRIPAKALNAYIAAEKDGYGCDGVGAAVAAAIGKRESRHGQSTLPGVHSGSNSAGAAGPEQFGIGGRAGPTWQHVMKRAGAGTGRSGVNKVYDIKYAARGTLVYVCELKHQGKGRSVTSAVSAYSGNTKGYASAVMADARQYQASPKFRAGKSTPKFEWPKASKSKSKSKVKPFKWPEPAKPKSPTKSNTSKGSPAKKVAMKDARGKRVGTAEVSVLDSVFGRCGITVVVPGATDVRVKAVGQDPRLVRTQSWTNPGKANFAPQHDSDGSIVVTAKINGKSAKAESLHLSLSKSAVGIGSSSVACGIGVA